MKSKEAKETIAIIERLVAKGFKLTVMIDLDWTVFIDHPGSVTRVVDKEDAPIGTELSKTHISGPLSGKTLVMLNREPLHTHVHGPSFGSCIQKLEKYLDGN